MFSKPRGFPHLSQMLSSVRITFRPPLTLVLIDSCSLCFITNLQWSNCGCWIILKLVLLEKKQAVFCWHTSLNQLVTETPEDQPWPTAPDQLLWLGSFPLTRDQLAACKQCFKPSGLCKALRAAGLFQLHWALGGKEGGSPSRQLWWKCPGAGGYLKALLAHRRGDKLRVWSWSQAYYPTHIPIKLQGWLHHSRTTEFVGNRLRNSPSLLL